MYVITCCEGIANGMYVNLVVLYISESAPAHLASRRVKLLWRWSELGLQRGSFVSLFQPFTTLGTFIGAVVSNALHLEAGKHSYQFQLLILYAVPTWLAIVVWLIPESPRWLAVQGL